MNDFEADSAEEVLDQPPAPDKPILATDLDGTLIPLEQNPRNKQDLKTLLHYRLMERFTLVFVSGRHKESICEAICEQHLPLPDWVISDVGTTIYRAEDPFMLTPIDSYREHLNTLTDGYPIEQLDDIALTFESMRRQEPEKQGTFKRSFYADADRTTEIADKIREVFARDDLPFAVVDSIDPFTNDGLVDLLPRGVSKAYALRWWTDHIDRPREAVVFAGDSGNDMAAFTAGYRTIVVGNTDRSIAAAVAEEHRRQDWAGRLYLAEGQATTGVLEGCRHFGLLD